MRPESRGSITKTGNTQTRGLLVEAAWHHRAVYRIGQTNARPMGPGSCGAHHRWAKFIERRKRPSVADVAIAHQLAGWKLVPGRHGRPDAGLTTNDVLRRPRLVAARGATHDSPMNNELLLVTLDPRHVVPLLPKAQSCDNQPAHMSLTGASPRTRSPATCTTSTRCAPRPLGTGTSPCHLTRDHFISDGKAKNSALRPGVGFDVGYPGHGFRLGVNKWIADAGPQCKQCAPLRSGGIDCTAMPDAGMQH